MFGRTVSSRVNTVDISVVIETMASVPEFTKLVPERNTPDKFPNNVEIEPIAPIAPSSTGVVRCNTSICLGVKPEIPLVILSINPLMVPNRSEEVMALRVFFMKVVMFANAAEPPPLE